MSEKMFSQPEADWWDRPIRTPQFLLVGGTMGFGMAYVGLQPIELTAVALDTAAPINARLSAAWELGHIGESVDWNQSAGDNL